MVLRESQSGWDTIVPALVFAFVLGNLVVLIFIRGADANRKDQETTKSKIRRKHR